ncbi:hypothetical protein RN001_000431 [Aquatica leii]|uniref:Disks large-associated protein 1 n=1 Tax=Aquatica leii TaxID=1421715 RepID=A0AAN7SSG0_9COLE|nr:hypothetical protein RN001_000431 [Aquatica leii]
MGKRKRINQFITKWIKSDIPDDRSSVLLLGVTRIPTTPTAARRPCSLPLGTTPFFPQNNPIAQHKSRKNYPSRRNTLTRQHSLKQRGNNFTPSTSQKEIKIKRELRSRSSTLSSSESISTSCDQKCFSDSNDITPTNSYTNSSEFTPGPTMDRSVDSIGACSLDADVSADLTDWSEQSSVGTLRSLSITTPEPQPYLPSYLSLACTVSGYSTTTNYDPERLSRSRDASPNRRHDDLNPASPNKTTPTYNIRNNLLSPPNLVPLPHHKYSPIVPDSHKTKNMEDQVEKREIYTSSRISSSYSQEIKHYTSSVICKDTVDGCVKNGHDIKTRCITLESRSMSNGSGKVLSETYKEYGNGIQQKSFIQQRVERLYGPGALAQGFFISKRQKNMSESEQDRTMPRSPNDKHSKSMSDKLLDDVNDSNLRTSASSPTLPVMRHLRPEFRAQLPLVSPKKVHDITLPKSQTIPILSDEKKLNGHSTGVIKTNGMEPSLLQEDDAVKDGHYFLRILEKESVRLLTMADQIEKELDEKSMSEEVKGKLRSASGKARLLTSQKMQQFRGLCTNNLTQKAGEAFPTTNEDLQGFWDMVLLQVDQVDELFKEIDKLRANNWVEIEPVIQPDQIPNGNVPKSRKSARLPRPAGNVNSAASKEREAKRKQLIEERRKAMRQQKQTSKENIEIFVPESS